MVSNDTNANGSSTAEAWDFESAVELIRLQTLALGRTYDESSALGRHGLVLSTNDKNDMLDVPSLGDFQEVLKYFATPNGKTKEAVEAEVLAGVSVAKETPLVKEDDAPEDRTNSQPSSDDGSEALAKERNADIESQDRRRVIHHLMGFSDEDRKAKKQSKPLPFTPASIRIGPMHKGRGPKEPLPGPDKKLQIMELLFGDSKQNTLVARLSSSEGFPMHRANEGSIHVFVDISNILIGFHDALKRIRGIHKDVHIPRERLCFFNFSLVLERGRSCAKRVLAGSDDLESVEEARQMGYEVNLLQRVYKSKDPLVLRKGVRRRRDVPSGDSESEGIVPSARRVEQGVDEILHLKMLESIVDTEVPSVIVLASGDAAEAEYSGGFLRMLERALSRGWRVEVVAFRENLSAAYRSPAWLKRWNDAFAVIELDPFAELLRLD